MKENKIDFVVLWVDGSDEKWIKEKEKYLGENGDKSITRFRDWDFLKYLFRGIESYAPWVNKIFFITYGHVPKWMDTSNDKIRLVRHDEFIPKEYLPTFNSNVIELNLHRIKDLSENFVLFNDDLVILRPLKKCDFFKKGIPCDRYIEYEKKAASLRHITIRRNVYDIIYKHFNTRKSALKNICKYINFHYSLCDNLRNFYYIYKNQIYDIANEHLTRSFAKNTFFDLWDKEYTKLNNSCYNKFRKETDIGSGVFRMWQLLSGKFVPRFTLGKYFVIGNNNDILIHSIVRRKYKIICINDANPNIDFEKVKSDICKSLDRVFPNKSSFEI